MLKLLLAFALDYLIGDPYRLPHPVRWIGSLIGFGLKQVRRLCHTDRSRLACGAALCLAVVLISGGAAYLVLCLAYKINLFVGIIAETIVCFYCLCAKQLQIESTKVQKCLEAGDIEGARWAVSMIVGRDTAALDEGGITRAAVETVAENTSDGVIAPLLYMSLFGGVGGIVYKAVNTLDSMVGYVDGDFLYIGRVSARLDDLLNFIPSRLSALLMVLAALICGMDYRAAYKIWRRDGRKHASPNSAQTEAACAGALGVRLAGDAYYFGILHKKQFIGDNKRETQSRDIERANRLMYTSCLLCLCLLAAVRRVIILWLW